MAVIGGLFELIEKHTWSIETTKWVLEDYKKEKSAVTERGATGLVDLLHDSLCAPYIILDVNKSLRVFEDIIDKEKLRALHDAGRALFDVYDYVRRKLIRRSIGKPLSEVQLPIDDPSAARAIEDARRVRDALSKAVRPIELNIDKTEMPTLQDLLDDAMAMSEVVVGELREALARHAVSNKVIAKDPNPVLLDACRDWERIARYLKGKGVYDEDVYDAALCKVFKDKARGDAAHIYLSERDVAKLYLDDNSISMRNTVKPFVEVVKGVLEDVEGVRCEITELSTDEYDVTCRFPRDKVKEVVRRLAPLISFKHRVSELVTSFQHLNYWKPRDLMECAGVKDPVECEFRMLKKAFEELKKS
ncbi:MAG: hypothetical protein QXQ20_09065 [Candidatus Nezhaarchaeales archaeon]